MNFYKTITFILFLLLPFTVCAKKDGDTKAIELPQRILLDSGDVFMYEKNVDGKCRANYFSARPANTKQLAKRITWILEQVKANAQIVEFTRVGLVKNRRLKKPEFTLPVTDAAGTTHKFIYSSHEQRGFYSINYSCSN